MTTAEVALLISGLALGWNVYRDVILKPKVKVSLQISSIISAGDVPEERPAKIDFTATNFGPGVVRLEGFRVKIKKFLRKTRWGIFLNDFADSLSHQFPLMLNVGDKGTFLIPYQRRTFLGGEFTKVGIADSFGRVHWVPKKHIKRVKEQYQKDFGGNDHHEI